MDSYPSSTNEGITFLTSCVSDEMSACEAADATQECWTTAAEALAPVIGREGLGIVFRNGEVVAARNVKGHHQIEPRPSMGTFCRWVKGLESREALAACKAFLVSVEHYLISLVGVASLRRILRRGRTRR